MPPEPQRLERRPEWEGEFEDAQFEERSAQQRARLLALLDEEDERFRAIRQLRALTPEEAAQERDITDELFALLFEDVEAPTRGTRQ